jgi:AbrB family looped-hinge helix DNA binding protein
MTARVIHGMKIGPQGRVVIPADVRRELGLHEGQELAVRLQDGALVIRSREAALDRLAGALKHLEPDGHGVERFLEEKAAESRVEAQREAAWEGRPRRRRPT